MVTCYSNGNYSQLMHDHSCLFTVGTVVCNGIVENISIAVTVPMIGAGKGPTNSRTSSSGLRILYRLKLIYRDYFFVLFFNRCCSIKLNCRHSGSCDRNHIYRDCFIM